MEPITTTTTATATPFTKKLLQMVRAVYYMLRKGIPKRRLLADLHLLLKRGRIARKALFNLMFHNHNKHHHMVANPVAIDENAVFAFASPSPLPLWLYGKSPLPVRQLRITDSPFPWVGEEGEEDGGAVDEEAEAFIERFYEQLRMQQQMVEMDAGGFNG